MISYQRHPEVLGMMIEIRMSMCYNSTLSSFMQNVAASPLHKQQPLPMGMHTRVEVVANDLEYKYGTHFPPHSRRYHTK